MITVDLLLLFPQPTPCASGNRATLTNLGDLVRGWQKSVMLRMGVQLSSITSLQPTQVWPRLYAVPPVNGSSKLFLMQPALMALRRVMTG
jgi:hypothetical protein